MRVLPLLLILSLGAVPAKAEVWGIQVGAFKEFARAEEIQEILEDAEYPSYLVEANGYKKVRVGPFDLRSSADREAAALKAFLIARFGVGEFEKPIVIVEDRPVENAAVRKRDAKEAEKLGALSNVVTIPSEEAAEIINYARTLIGSPYRWAGTGPGVFDCSGFTTHVFREKNYDLPRSARDQFQFGREVTIENLLPGDLVFFQTYASYPSHVGIYLGDGKMIHAPKPGANVRVESIYYMPIHSVVRPA